MSQQLLTIVVAAGAIFVVGIIALVIRCYRKVDQGRALIINKLKAEPDVTFTGGVVLPIVHRAEVMDISVKTIEIDRRGGKEGLICQDNLRADIKVTFFLRVNKTKEDVLRVAQSIGCARASDKQTLEELFGAKFSEGLKTVGKKLDFEQLYTQRDDFKDQIIRVIGKDLNGYILEDAAIDFLEQTSLAEMDVNNILDARGIQKITEITTNANVRTNELKQKERMEIGDQNLKADEAIFRFDQQRAEAMSRRDKEIAIAQTREHNEATRIKLDEEKQTAVKNQKVAEEVQLAEIAKLRATDVAAQARAREVEVEKVRVEKATDLEQVERQREVALRSIDKEKQVEVEKKEIANIISQRIAVEKSVAQEEENINDLRAGAGAKRSKDVAIIGAEAQAQEILIKDIKKAEAEEEVAKAHARKKLIEAEADLEASDKQARAKMRMSEGVQAEEAATGLAQVRVREANATAIEKEGLASVKVREAAVTIAEREGMTEAKVVREKHIADAAGIEQKGLADARAREAAAAAAEKLGLAEAVSLREKLMAEVVAKEATAAAVEKNMLAEAAGLAQKAKAMQALEGTAREHEEFRLRLEKELEFALEQLKANVAIAEQQARVLGQAFANASFNIVGGDGAFFDRFVKAVSLGQSIDGALHHSEVLKNVFGKRLNGEGDLIEDLKDVVQSAGVSSEAVKNLSISAVLGQMLIGADDTTKTKVQLLLEKARELGVDKIRES